MTLRSRLTAASLTLAGALLAVTARADVVVQCPGDLDGDAVPESPIPGVSCLHLAAGDGFVRMADGREMYMFGFSDVTGVLPHEVMERGMLGAAFPAPLITADEGTRLYLNLTNVGMTIRPDLFDPHSVHWHGFPNAAPVFDGVPDSSISINMGSTLTYFYEVPGPGTYMYHCHVEATEHMQMGMLGNLYVRPRQDRLPAGTNLSGFVHQAGFRYAYNDGDGSTYYDVDAPLQLGSFDSAFHDASESVQPLPFHAMKDDYPMINGRGYPHTVIAGALPAPTGNGGKVSQSETALVTAARGQKLLLRLSNLNVTRFHTVATTGLRMRVVGVNAKHLRSATTGENLYYDTMSVTLGGGESLDAIVDTSGVQPGTYFLYTTNLHLLANGPEGGGVMGGMLTEIRITP
jgi:FtsP/CotA-like multicopper oxidase with cupredoxin domain